MRRSTALFLFLSLAIGFVLFQVKYAVVEIEQTLAQTMRNIQRENDNLHILKAEWSHLNEPQRLQKLTEKFLDVMPMQTQQIATIDNSFGRECNLEDFLPHTHLASFKGEE